MFNWFTKEETPDEQLIKELKEAVGKVAELGNQANSRGITVWLKEGTWAFADILLAKNLRFDQAYKTQRTEF